MKTRRGIGSRKQRRKKLAAKPKRYYVESRGRRREISEAEALHRMALGLPVLALGIGLTAAALSAVQ